MIKINLLAERKSRTRTPADRGLQIVMLGALCLVLAGVGVFFLVHVPLGDEIDGMLAQNKEIEAENKKIAKQTKDLSKMQAAVKAAEEQEKAIERLRDARATPAWLLWELSNILTRNRQPSVTREMRRRLETDPNRRWQEAWDAKNVWVTDFTEKKGKFKLSGGAQSDSDVTQLALRMQASVYFDNVQPDGGSEATDGKTGVNYYKFTISGKVRY